MGARNTPDADNGTIKDPAEWTTGDEPMTGAGLLPPHARPQGR